MKPVVLIMMFHVLKLASCYPIPDRNYDSCLILTEERYQQINYIENRLSQFLGDLENEFEDIDITNVKVNVEKHTDGEPPKNSVITVTVNDCSENEHILDSNTKDVNEPTDAALQNAQQENAQQENAQQENTEQENTQQENTQQEYTQQEYTQQENTQQEYTQQKNTEQENYNESANDDENPADANESRVTDDYQTDNQDCSTQLSDENNTRSNDETDTFEECNDSAPGIIDNDTEDISTTIIPRPKSKPEMIVVELNKDELRRVQDMERRTGNKPFVLIEYENGKREIKFLQ